jgi:hypothetical protein
MRVVSLCDKEQVVQKISTDPDPDEIYLNAVIIYKYFA